MENKKKTYTGMKSAKIEFNKNDVIATSGGCESMAPKTWPLGLCGDWTYTNVM